MLEGGQPLALATDEGAERLLLVTVGHDVEPARLAGLDLDADVEPEVPHQALEDRLAGREGLGRRLGGLQVGSLGGQRSARGRRPRRPPRRVRPAEPPRAGARSRSSRRGLVVPARRAIVTRSVVAARAVVAARRAVVTRAVVTGSVVARPRSSRRGGRSSAGSVVAARRGSRQRRRGGGLALGSRSAQRRARRGDDPGRLGAHAEDAPAARRQDLEVEVVELRRRTPRGRA